MGQWFPPVATVTTILVSCPICLLWRPQVGHVCLITGPFLLNTENATTSRFLKALRTVYHIHLSWLLALGSALKAGTEGHIELVTK